MDKRLHTIDEALREDIASVLQHPYFLWLKEGSTTKDSIRDFAEQYTIASEGFPIFLALACASISNESIRLPILKNLWDEHGCGDLEKSHRQFLKRFTTSVNMRNEIEPSKKTKTYIHTMNSLCTNQDTLLLLGVLGPGLENTTPPIYKILVEAFEAYGCSDEDLFFFHDHIFHDEFHSDDFNNAILKALDIESNVEKVITGAKLAIKAECVFWDGLFENLN